MPLEGLDFVIDPVAQKLIGNPAHERDMALFDKLGITPLDAPLAARP